MAVPVKRYAHCPCFPLHTEPCVIVVGLIAENNTWVMEMTFKCVLLHPVFLQCLVLNEHLNSKHLFNIQEKHRLNKKKMLLVLSKWNCDDQKLYSRHFQRVLVFKRVFKSGMFLYLFDWWLLWKVHSATAQLNASQSAIINASHSIRIILDDLKAVSEKIDIITSCQILPDINISA